MKQTAIYARCSTTADRQDVSKQVDTLKRFCTDRGLTNIRVYQDYGSGASDDREAYTELLDAVRKGKVSTVCVYRFDRFSRSVRTLVSALEEFQERNVAFISYSENISTDTPAGKALFVVASAFAEMERAICRERICDSLRLAKERGIVLGRRRVQFDTAKALELKTQGLGVRRIAKQLGVSKSVVHRYLSSVPNTSPAKPAE